MIPSQTLMKKICKADLKRSKKRTRDGGLFINFLGSLALISQGYLFMSNKKARDIFNLKTTSLNKNCSVGLY